MASHGTLPLYYKNSKPTGLSGPAKSWKDNYLLVVVLVGFLILIAGTFWFLPPLGDKDGDYEKTYGRFMGNPASYITDVVIPSEPTLEPPEATGKAEGGNGEVGERRLTEEGGRKNAGMEPNEPKVEEPVRLEEKGRGQVQSFHKQPPSTSEATTEPTTSEPPSSLEPLEQDDPDEESKEKEEPSEVRGGEKGVVDEVASDPEAEERRKKVVEVCHISITIWQ